MATYTARLQFLAAAVLSSSLFVQRAVWTRAPLAKTVQPALNATEYWAL